MAPRRSFTNKRKRNTSYTTPKKKRRRDTDSEPEYPAKRILQETETQFLIEWDCVDPDTNEPYEPSWVVKSDANEALTTEWEQDKARQRAVRASRVIEEDSSYSPEPPPSPTQATISSPVESHIASPVIPAPPGRSALHVQIKPPSDFDPDDFERFSQLLSQQQELAQTQTSSQSASSLIQRNSREHYRSSGVVEDSQSSHGSASYIQTTQEGLGSTQERSSGTINGTNDLVDEVGPPYMKRHALFANANPQDSLFIPEQFISRHSSPFPASDPIEIIEGTTQSGPQLRSEEDFEDTVDVQENISQENQDIIEIPESPIQNDTYSLDQGAVNQGDSIVGIASQALSDNIEVQSGQTPTSESIEQPVIETITIGSSIAPTVSEKGIGSAAILTQEPPKYPGRESAEESLSVQITSESSGKRPATPEVESLHQSVPETVVQSNRTALELSQGIVQRQVQGEEECVGPRDFVELAQTKNSTSNSEYSDRQPSSPSPPEQQRTQEQNAQLVPPDLYQETQSQSVGTVLPTTEVDDFDQADTPKSRHDSSQESPSPSRRRTVASQDPSLDKSFPPRPPPLHSIDTSVSTAPPRPKTPVNTSSSLSTNMAEPNYSDIEKSIEKKFKEVFQANREARPFVPPASRLQTVDPAAGTRSPSTIPDRSPQRQEPTSLRTAALMNSTTVEAPEAPPLISPSVVTDIPEAPDAPTIDIDEDVYTGIDVEDDVAEDESDIDDNKSLLNDDIQLMPDEYLVPLPMEGRQHAAYRHEVQRNQDVLKSFLDNPQDFSEIDEINKVIQRLKDVESHVDLIFAESSSQEAGALTQATWDFENCVKFRFLGSFLSLLRERDMNIMVVLKEDHERLFGILERYLQHRFHNYRYPAKDRRADESEIEGPLMVTLLSSDSSPIVRPPSVIICLDGANSNEIRKKNWATNPDRTVPIIQLAIPRSVGHIEQCVTASLSPTKRLHTIIASLAQISPDFGSPLVDSTPRATEAAELVARYLISLEDVNLTEAPEWPLPPIGSVKDVIEYKIQSQLPQESNESPPPRPATSCMLFPSSYIKLKHVLTIPLAKRPLDDEELDPAKRVRLTPQQEVTSSGNANADAEVTHISDSLPGTAAEISNLQDQLATTQAALSKAEKALVILRASDAHHREIQASWDRRQYDFEDLSKQHRLLMNDLEAEKKRVEQATKSKESSMQRVEQLRSEVLELRAKLGEQEKINLASDDEKIREITRWQKEASDERAAKERAIKSREATDSMLSFLQEQRRNAEEQAVRWKEDHATLLTEVEALHRKSGENDPRLLRKEHEERAIEVLRRQLELEKAKTAQLNKILERKDEEITRFREKGKGYGTRGSSVPRSPRVGGPGSRATSPLPRDRVSNLRNG